MKALVRYHNYHRCGVMYASEPAVSSINVSLVTQGSANTLIVQRQF
jgi:hypothetical protein